MNYHKLQLSFILLLIMTTIQLITSLLVLQKLWLVITSLIAITLCIVGIIYTIHKETEHKK